MTLSINIIAKNEENYIEECINSINNIADEIIFLDTGSKDKTKEIALKYSKVKLYELKWEDYEYNIKNATWGFQDPHVRNKAIEYSTCDWILSLDADERLTTNSQPYLLDLLEEHKYTQNTVFSLFYKNLFNFHSESYFKSSLFKNDSKIKYFKPIHPYPYIENVKTNFITCPNIVIDHIERNLDKDRREQNTNRYITELELIIADSTEQDKLYYLKHLGDAYLTDNNYDKSLKAYIESNNLYDIYKPINVNPLIYGSNLNKIIEILVEKKKEYSKAIKFAEELILITPKTVKGFYYMGFCYQHLKDFEKALENYKRAFRNATENNDSSEIITFLEKNIFFLSRFV